MWTENRRMAVEITELKFFFNKYLIEISFLKKSLNKVFEDNDKLKKSVDLLKKKVEE